MPQKICARPERPLEAFEEIITELDDNNDDNQFLINSRIAGFTTEAADGLKQDEGGDERSFQILIFQDEFASAPPAGKEERAL